MNWGFRNSNTYEISKKEETTFELDAWLGKKDKVLATTKEDLYVTVNKKNFRHLTVSIEYEGPITAPINKGAKVAEITVSNKDKIINNLILNFEKLMPEGSVISGKNYLNLEIAKKLINNFLKFEEKQLKNMLC